MWNILKNIKLKLKIHFMMIKLCEKHYTGTPYQIKVFDETKCEFCLSELRERMKKFGIADFKQILEEDKKLYGTR